MKSLAPTTRRKIELINLRTLCAVILSFAFTLSLTTPALYAQGTFMRVETFSLRPEGRVQIENPRGAIRVEGWDDSTVRILAEKKTSGGSLDPSELMLMSAQETVFVQCKHGARPGRIDLMVYVPRRAPLQVTGGAFPIDVSGVAAGAVVESTAGHINYRLPASSDAQVVMHSSRGVVRSNVALQVTARTGATNLQGRVGGGSTPIIITSQSGNITLSPGPALAQAAGPQIAASQSHPRGNDPASGINSRDGSQGGYTSDARLNENTLPSSDQHYGREEPEAGGSRRGAWPQPQSNQSPSVQPRAGGGSVVFAGGSTSSDETSEDRSGPFYRPRRETRTSDSSAGLRVRIIPADTPLGAKQSRNDSIYDSPVEDSDASDDQQFDPFGTADKRASRAPGSNPSNPGRPQRPTYGSQSGAYNPRPQADRAADSDDPLAEMGPAATRSGAPPVLRRSNGSPEPNENLSPAASTTGSANEGDEEEAIVLKSALVNLSVSVTNRAGVAFSDLNKEDFEVLENGERQAVEFFAPSTAPFNLVLLLDLSGSIKDKLKVVKEAALRFIETVGPQDKVAVLAFTHKVGVISQLTANRDLLRKRIKEIEEPEGGTAFYEAMWFALADTLRGTQGQRNAIVVMTDGVDSSLDRWDPAPTRVSYKQLSQRLEESDVLVFPIYVDTEYEDVFVRGNSTAEAYAIARMQLEKIADLTGGQMFQAQRVNDLAGVYKRVAAAIRTVYSVGYYPTNPERDGTYRRIRVSVDRPEAAVRTRKGYYAR